MHKLTEKAYEMLEEAAANLYVKALKEIPRDVILALQKAYEEETNEIAKNILKMILGNIEIASKIDTLVCQDTGIPVYMVRIREDVEVNLARLRNAITKGCENAVLKNNLRPNIVHPITRKNTMTNTGPGMPVIEIETMNNDNDVVIEITALPKGSGSENCSYISMLSPADGVVGVKRFVLESVVNAGGKPCPPIVLGVGIGGSFDSAARLAKRALFRKIGTKNPDPHISRLEDEILNSVNSLGIGPMGLGGRTTALAVNIEHEYTHISCLPVAVNIQCWRSERATAVLNEGLELSYLD